MSGMKIVVGLLLGLVILYFVNRSSSDDPLKNEGILDTRGSGYRSSSSGADIDLDDDGIDGDMHDLADPEWDSQFDSANRVTAKTAPEEDAYAPRDESHGNLASYRAPPPRQASSAQPVAALTDGGEDGWDLYNADDYMPKEKHSDWFEVVKVPTKIKDQHLLTNQIGYGIDTVGQSMKNANHDLRPSPPCPKYTVSPWNQSTIEADYNRRSLC
jgi:hypothetical protein